MPLSDLQNIKHFDKISHCIGALVIWLFGLITGYPIEAGGVAIAFYYGREQAQAERKTDGSIREVFKTYFFMNWNNDARWDVLAVVLFVSFLNIIYKVIYV